MTEQPRVSIVKFLPEGKTVEDIAGIGGILDIGEGNALYFSTMWNGKDSQEPYDDDVVAPELLKSNQMAKIIGFSGIYKYPAYGTEVKYIDLCYMTLGISKRGNLFMEEAPIGTRLNLMSLSIERLPIGDTKIRHLELYF